MHIKNMLLFCIVVLLFNLWLLLRTYLPLWRWKMRPPGPPVLPLFGSIFSMAGEGAAEHPYRAVHILAQKYGPVMSLGLGSDMWVVLTGADEIKRFSMMEEGVARPEMKTLNQMYSYDKALGVIFPDGPLWREQRKFMVTTLREFGVGKNKMEEHIQDELMYCQQHIEHLIHTNGGCLEMEKLFDLPCLNVIWRLVCGRRFDNDDEALPKLIQCLETFTMEQAIGPIGSMAYLKYIPHFKEIYQTVKGQMDNFKSFIKDFVDKERSSRDPDVDRGFVDSFLRAQESNAGDYFLDDQLVISVLDFFTGGSGTMSKTLAYAFLFMIKHQEWQDKIREEIRQFQQESNAFDVTIPFSARAKLPLTEATLLECQRLASVLPVAPPRMATKDIHIGKYLIPKGTRVQMNLYSLHRDVSHWDNPEEFKPERFINMIDGKPTLKLDEWLQPFGYGKRKCLGENVAKSTAFVFFCNLISKFEFKVACGQNPDELDESPSGGLTIGPKPYTAIVTRVRE